MDEKIYIDGQWVAPSGRATLDVINPATEVAFTRIAAATAEDVDRAVVAARRAFDGGWKRTTGHERAAFLRGIAAHIRNRQPELARLEVRGQRQAAARGRLGRRRRGRLLRILRGPRGGAGCATGRAHRGARRPVPFERALRARRRRRADHSLELSAADGGVEGGARACGRLHHGAEAFGADARSRR